MAIYIRAGREIYNKRRKMLNFSSTGTTTAVGSEPFSPLSDEFSSAFNFKTTEVVQTTEIIQPPPPTAMGGDASTTPLPLKSYSVTISADVQHPHTRPSLDDLDTLNTTTATLNSIASDTSNNNNPVARVTSTTNPPRRTITNAIPIPTYTTPTPANDIRTRRRNVHDTHSATWSYTKCAILFFAALLITWIPSSGNRVYSLINGGATSKPLFFASAFVLPLQGFWNAIIYIVTSWAACKSLWGTGRVVVSGWWHGWRGKGSGSGGHGIHQEWSGKHPQRGSGGVVGGMWGHTHGRKLGKEESTSMEDLTGEGRIDRVTPV